VPAAADAIRSGAPELRRATIALAITQLMPDWLAVPRSEPAACYALIVAGHMPLHAFATANARLQTSATIARALGPLIVGGAAAHAGWTGGWALVAGGLSTATAVFAALGMQAGRVPVARADLQIY
jgi:hypothetical protein